MSFNPDISNQAHEIIFFGKWFVQLDKKLDFQEYLSKVESKVNKTISIILKLQNLLQR